MTIIVVREGVDFFTRGREVEEGDLFVMVEEEEVGLGVKGFGVLFIDNSDGEEGGLIAVVRTGAGDWLFLNIDVLLEYLVFEGVNVNLIKAVRVRIALRLRVLLRVRVPVRERVRVRERVLVRERERVGERVRVDRGLREEGKGEGAFVGVGV